MCCENVHSLYGYITIVRVWITVSLRSLNCACAIRVHYSVYSKASLSFLWHRVPFFTFLVVIETVGIQAMASRGCLRCWDKPDIAVCYFHFGPSVIFTPRKRRSNGLSIILLDFVKCNSQIWRALQMMVGGRACWFLMWALPRDVTSWR